MKTIFEPEAYKQIDDRIRALEPGALRQWGRMNAAQMMAHCSMTLEVVTDKRKVPQRLIGRLIGRFFKASYLGDKPFPKNSPTNPMFVIVDEKEFATEKARFLGLVKEFAEGGVAKCTRQPHSFFGPLTPEEWGRTTYKHLDHHLRQFGA